MSSEAPLSKVIVALDCNNENDALEIANLLDPKLCNLKIGLELFISCGPSIIKKIHNLNYKIFLDLTIASFNFSLHTLCLCDLPIGEFFKTSILHPGRLEHGPLEKFGLFGLLLGFSINIFFRYISF